MKLNLKIFAVSVCMLAGCLFTACKDDKEVAISKPDIEFIALSQNNVLNFFNASDVRTPLKTVTVTGALQTGETILAIDFRPTTGQLYGLGSTGRVYLINTSSGTTNTTTGTPGAATLIAGPISTPFTHNVAGFDFNPASDRLRVMTFTVTTTATGTTITGRQNYSINPETGVISQDSDIGGEATSVMSSCAYSNNYAGATSTTLYDIDVTTQTLYKQDPPAGGALTTVGSLGLPASSANSGFDISADGIALSIIKNGSNSALYQVDLETGKASTLGSIANNAITATTFYTGIAIVPRPVAYAVSENNDLVIFNPANVPAGIINKSISGLQAGENILGIDFRPATSQLYALGSGNNIYTINLGSGVATKVNTLPLIPALSGTSFGFDFNPTADLIRVISNTGQNLRVSPTTGLVTAVDPNVNPGTPAIAAAAYTSNAIGATAATSLYVIDKVVEPNTDPVRTSLKLYTQNATTGALTSVGAATVRLGSGFINANASGFDISGATGTAYAIINVVTATSPAISTATRVYTINLSTGAATQMHDFPISVKGFSLGLGF